MEPTKNHSQTGSDPLSLTRSDSVSPSLQLASIHLDPENTGQAVCTAIAVASKALPTALAPAPLVASSGAGRSEPATDATPCGFTGLVFGRGSSRHCTLGGTRPNNPLGANPLIHKTMPGRLSARLRAQTSAQVLGSIAPLAGAQESSEGRAAPLSILSPKTLRVLSSVMPQGDRELTHSLDQGKFFVIHENIEKFLRSYQVTRTQYRELLIGKAKLHMEAAELTETCEYALEALVILSSDDPSEQAENQARMLPFLYEKLSCLPESWLREPRHIVGLHAREPYTPSCLQDPAWVERVLAHAFFCVWHETVFTHAYERHFF